MRKYIALDCLIDLDDFGFVSNHECLKVQQSLLAPPLNLRPYSILQALQRGQFKYHRTISFYNISKGGEEVSTCLLFLGHRDIDNLNIMSPSSNTSLTNTQPQPQDPDRCSVGQQTEITCRPIPIPILTTSLDSDRDPHNSQRTLRDSLAFSSPATSILSYHNPVRSTSIFSTVCALLLNKQGLSSPKSVTSLHATPSDNICRICFGGESTERLVRPCDCRGTIATVHRSCLERWLLQASSSYCELCRHHYLVTRTHKWTWIRSLVEWGRSGRGRALLADAWRAVALGAASVLGTARALQMCDRMLQIGAKKGGSVALAANLLSSVIIGIIGALNGLLTTWMLLKVQEHQLSWQAWRDSTLHLHVTLSDDRTLTPSLSEAALLLNEVNGTTRDRGTNVADPFMVEPPSSTPST